MEKSEGATLLGPEGQGTPDKKATDQHAELGWWSAAAFQATWSTSSSTVIVPFTFAQLGYVIIHHPRSLLASVGSCHLHLDSRLCLTCGTAHVLVTHPPGFRTHLDGNLHFTCVLPRSKNNKGRWNEWVQVDWRRGSTVGWCTRTLDAHNFPNTQ